MVPYSAVDIVNAMRASNRGMRGHRRFLPGGKLRQLVSVVTALTPWVMAGMLWTS